VRINRDRYELFELFEKMRWICFHFEFEHTPESIPMSRALVHHVRGVASRNWKTAPQCEKPRIAML
jgi:hypothetical protein